MTAILGIGGPQAARDRYTQALAERSAQVEGQAGPLQQFWDDVVVGAPARAVVQVGRALAIGGTGVMATGAGAVAGSVAGLRTAATEGISAGIAEQRRVRENVTADVGDPIFKDIEEDTDAALQYFTPDPRDTGVASAFVADVVEFLTPLAIPFAGPALVAGTQTTNTALELADEGVDTGTAVTAGALTGALSYAGIKLPAAIGTTRTGRAALGAGIGAGFGIAERGSVQALLSERFPDLAERYDALNPRAILLDAAINGLVGAAVPIKGADGKVRAGRFRLRQNEINKAFDYLKAEESRAPQQGYAAINPRTQAVHDVALQKAQDTLIKGTPFDPPPLRTEDGFIETPETARLREAGARAYAQVEADTGAPRAYAQRDEAVVRFAQVFRQLEDSGEPVTIAGLRAELPDIPLEQFDQVVSTLQRSGDLEAVDSTGTPFDESDIDVPVALGGDAIIRRRTTPRSVDDAELRTDQQQVESDIQEFDEALLDERLEALAETSPQYFTGGLADATPANARELLMRERLIDESEIRELEAVRECAAGGAL